MTSLRQETAFKFIEQQSNKRKICFLPCDDCPKSAIFLRNLCVKKTETYVFVTQPVRNQCDMYLIIGTLDFT